MWTMMWTLMVVTAHLMRRGPHGWHRLHGRPHLPQVRLIVPLPSASTRRSERDPRSRALSEMGAEPAKHCSSWLQRG